MKISYTEKYSLFFIYKSMALWEGGHELSPIHNYIPAIFQTHIDNWNGVFQVTQEIPFIRSDFAVDANNPRQSHGILSAWTEIKLDWSTTRLRINANSDVKKVTHVSATAFFEDDKTGTTKKKIKLVVSDIKDITQYLNPLDNPMEFQVEDTKDWATAALMYN